MTTLFTVLSFTVFTLSILGLLVININAIFDMVTIPPLAFGGVIVPLVYVNFPGGGCLKTQPNTSLQCTGTLECANSLCKGMDRNDKVIPIVVGISPTTCHSYQSFWQASNLLWEFSNYY